jgi:hypothetical protein
VNTAAPNPATIRLRSNMLHVSIKIIAGAEASANQVGVKA